jgi:Zn-finger nucleic acid-binding protein
MNCPRCQNVMTEMERHAVLVDVCPNCGGIWLDKGELAKILSHMREAEASLDMELNAARERDRHAQYPPSYRHGHDDHHHEGRYADDHQYSHRKKTGFQRLFDIFD